MGLKDFIPIKLKAFRLRRLIKGNGKRKNKRENIKPSWMTRVSHGYHVIESKWYMGELDSDESVFDSVIVQRDQIDDQELWFFQISDPKIGNGFTKLMQSHFFDTQPKRQIVRNSREVKRKVYIGEKAKMRESQNENETSKAGSVSVMIINEHKLVIANSGDYKAVLCKNGIARRINPKTHHRFAKTLRWSRRLISGCQAMGIAKPKLPQSSSDIVVRTERVDLDTEFLILASSGIWETMTGQEAVSLIRHLENPKEAAQCLAKEAMFRFSKSNISCLVIRFD